MLFVQYIGISTSHFSLCLIYVVADDQMSTFYFDAKVATKIFSNSFTQICNEMRNLLATNSLQKALSTAARRWRYAITSVLSL